MPIVNGVRVTTDPNNQYPFFDDEIYSIEATVTLAQLNAGFTFLPAAGGVTIKVVGYYMKCTGAFTTATDIRISDTTGTPVDVVTLAIAGATSGAVITEALTTNITLGTFGAPLTASQGLQLRKTGSSAAGGTSIFVMCKYKVNA